MKITHAKITQHEEPEKSQLTWEKTINQHQCWNERDVRTI